ncbi:glycosyltransferase [Salinicola avicenniae]|uniref:glycosyltransferase n=1 Tax=Salinicola avicenniae TaxID=2916836 RepID=UPI002073F151|nr:MULTISPECIES: glycosyltransferase [unclassified Salinicola]
MRHPPWVLLSDGACPTEDIYFLRAVAPWLRDRGIDVRRLDTRRWRSPWLARPWLIGALRGAHIIVCRTLAEPWIEWLECHRARLASVRYLIDDDIGAAATDANLPMAYRQRMRAFAGGGQPRLLALADEVIACSDHLARLFSQHHAGVTLLPPTLIAEPPDQAHFRDSGCRAGFHGTRAHLADLESIVPALTALHDGNASLTFEIMLGAFAPPPLQTRPRVETPGPMSWRAFQRYRRRARLHVGLTPLRDTAFNAGKSHIKFLDNAVVGCVGLYSDRAPYREIVSHGEDGLLVSDRPGAWQEAIQQLIDDPWSTRVMAKQAARKARELGDPERARAFWWVRR